MKKNLSVLLVLSFGFVLSCAQSVKKTIPNQPAEAPLVNLDEIVKEEKKPPNILGPSERQFTFKGNNWQPSYSPDGKKFIFTSSERHSHENKQVYEYHINSESLKRLTYQDGDTDGPHYSQNGKSIFFSSTTDEIKESPMLLFNTLLSGEEDSSRGLASFESENSQGGLFPFEIYKMDLDTQKILRMTTSKNMDKDVSKYSNRNFRAFSSVRQGNPEIHLFHINHPNYSRRLTKNSLTDISPEISPKGKEVLWVRYNKSGTFSQLILKKDNLPELEVSSGHFFHQSPTWHPDGETIFFSATSSSHQNFQIYKIKKDGTCLKRVTNNLFSDNSPSIHPQKKKILFDRKVAGKSHIIEKELKDFNNKCGENRIE